jgi:hypothetical protein
VSEAGGNSRIFFPRRKSITIHRGRISSSNTPQFGAASTPAPAGFGLASGFGTAAGSAYGSAAPKPFGAPAAAPSPYGAPSAGSAFGQPAAGGFSSAFGAPAAAAPPPTAPPGSGSRAAPYQKTQDTDQSTAAGGAKVRKFWVERAMERAMRAD